MFSPEELEAIRANMEEEHRKNMDALDRVMRFSFPNAVPRAISQLPLILPAEKMDRAAPNHADSTNAPSIIDAIRLVFIENPSRMFTTKLMMEELKQRRVELKAQSPLVTISVALKKLVDRDVIYIVRRGNGKDPHWYQLQGKLKSGPEGEDKLPEQERGLLRD